MEYSEDDQLLMDYLDGNLGAAGVQGLENRLLRETKLKQKLALYEWSRHAVRVKAIRDLVEQSQRDFLANREKSNLKPGKKAPTTLKFTPSFAQWVGVAASILIFLALAGVLFLNSISGTDLYQDKYLSYEISAFRGNLDHPSSIQDSYRNGDYAAVLDAAPMDDVLESLSKDDLLLLGISALEIGKPQQALIYLNILHHQNEKDHSGELQDEGEFYAALAHIQLEKYKEGYTLISHITQDTTHKYNRNFPLGYRAKIKMLSLLN